MFCRTLYIIWNNTSAWKNNSANIRYHSLNKKNHDANSFFLFSGFSNIYRQTDLDTLF